MLGFITRHSNSSHPSYVCFIQGADKVKIAVAGDPKKLLADLQCGSPVLLTIIGLIKRKEDATRLKASLHYRFAKYRKHLEWFEYSLEIRHYIQSITQKKNPKELS